MGWAFSVSQWLFYVGHLLICVGRSSRPSGGYFALSAYQYAHQRINTLIQRINTFTQCAHSAYQYAHQRIKTLIQLINTLTQCAHSAYQYAHQRINTLTSLFATWASWTRPQRLATWTSWIRPHSVSIRSTAYPHAPQRIHTLHSAFIRSHSAMATLASWQRPRHGWV